MQAIREIRNTFVPVSRLPPEILSRVLEYRTSERDLVAATHVCRYLRSTLISSSVLWTCFQFQSDHDLDRTLTYLERSEPAPIYATINISSSQDPEVLNYLVPHIARTRSLAILGSHKVHTSSLLFCNPAPSLQHLEINSSEGFVHLDDFLGKRAPSLRSVTFSGICPTFIFPLPNLTEFSLYLSEGTGPFRTSTLFRFFSNSPLLRKIHISVPSSKTVRDIPPNQTISLESLVELEYTHNPSDRVLPCLKLPRLKRLQVSCPLKPGQAQKLADILPYNGHAFLAGATKMLYHSMENYEQDLLKVELSGNGVSVTFTAFCTMDYPSVNWFTNQTCIPFCQIEDLKVESYTITGTDFPIPASHFKSLRVLRIASMNVQGIKWFLAMLHSSIWEGVPCRFLHEIECTFEAQWDLPWSLIRQLYSIARERKQAGHQLGLVRFLVARGSGWDFVEELRKHVGEVRVEEWDARPEGGSTIISGFTSMLNELLPFAADVHD